MGAISLQAVGIFFAAPAGTLYIGVAFGAAGQDAAAVLWSCLKRGAFASRGQTYRPCYRDTAVGESGYSGRKYFPGGAGDAAGGGSDGFSCGKKVINGDCCLIDTDEKVLL